MSRLSKFLRNPRKYFQDAAAKRRKVTAGANLAASSVVRERQPGAALPKNAKWHPTLERLQRNAEQLTEAREWTRAFTAWSEVVAHHPATAKLPARIVENYARTARNAGRADLGAALARRFIEERGRHPSILKEYAECAAELGDCLTAVALLEEFIVSRPNPAASAFSRLAGLLAQEGMFDAAVAAVKRGLAIHPGSDMLVKAERKIRLDFDCPFPPKNAQTFDTGYLFGGTMRANGVGVAAITIKDEPVNMYVRDMLGFGEYHLPVLPATPLEDVDVFMVWGATVSPMHDLCRNYAERFGKPLLTLEYGFVSSADIAANGAPQHSIIVCPGPIYFDSTQETAPAKFLNSSDELDKDLLNRARICIERLTATRVTKYNHAPILDMRERLKNSGRPKILLVDQRKGDKSVSLGLASATTFRRMFEHALSMEEYDIVVKLHPDAISGKYGSYLGDLVQEFSCDRIELVDYDVNPFSLFEAVDKVFVATSQLGFEAAFFGLEVFCFGAPFYAGWGFTSDMVAIPRRRRSRTVEEVFATFYLKFSKYHVPGSDQHELEDLIDYFYQRRPVSLPSTVLEQVDLSVRILMIVPSGRMGASGRYMQTLGEHLVGLGSPVLILSEGKWSRTVNGVRWEPIQFEGPLMSQKLRSDIQEFAPNVVYVNGVRTRAQRLALEAVALTGARLVTQAEDDDVDIYEHHAAHPNVGHLTALDHPDVSGSELQDFLGENNWLHTMEVLADPEFDRWVEPVLRIVTNRAAAAHTGIWYPYAQRLLEEYGKPTMVVPPVASKFDFDRRPALGPERAAILRRYGIDENRIVFFLGGSIYDYSNDFQVFLRALNILAENSSLPLALIVAGRSRLDVATIMTANLSGRVQSVHLNSPSDAVFMELMRASDVCCSPGLETRFNAYRLPSRLVKAMAMGQPVMTCRTGFGDALEHGENAVVTEGNNPEFWAEQLSVVLSSKQREELGAKGREFALEHFDAAKVAANLQHFFGMVLSAPKNPSPLGILDTQVVKTPDVPLEKSATFAGLESLMLNGLQTVDAVVHVGALSGSELNDYVRLGAQHVVLIENDPEKARELASHASVNGTVLVIGPTIANGSADMMGEVTGSAAMTRALEAYQDDTNGLLIIDAPGGGSELLESGALAECSGINYMLVRYPRARVADDKSIAEDLLGPIRELGFSTRIVHDNGDDAVCSIVAWRSRSDPSCGRV